ncbi:unnamed protein product [Cochlearia groenlandica]
MEFWGIEIKPGSPLMVEPEDGYIIHVSQIALGESKKVKDESVSVYVKVGDDKSNILIGNLSEKIPQVSLDLFFEREFEISHGCKNSSVFFLGYKTIDVLEEEDINSDEEDIPEEILNSLKEKIEGGGDSESDDDDEMDSDEEEAEEKEEEAPLKVEPPIKKRPNGEAMKNTNAASKKAKLVVPQKPSGQKKQQRK